jgi:hypothetical protein
MKIQHILGTLAVLISFILPARATTYYVAASNSNPVAPFTSWSTAATNIQDAINAATNGDLILVTNGIYSAGGLVIASTLTNRVALNKPLTVESVNGPWVTIIQGAGPAGPAAVRCAWVTNGAVLTGFTLQGGTTSTAGTANNEYGGGVWCVSASAVVDDCVIISNTAEVYGGGVYQGTLNNCLVAQNSSVDAEGGGAAYATLYSCTVVNNAGVGVAGGVYTNCIVFYNGTADHLSGGVFAYCCTTVPPSGVGNITNSPQLFADGVHLLTGSPCIGAGINVVTGTDIFGNAWANPPSLGCAEWEPAPLVTQPAFQYNSYSQAGTFNVISDGQAPLSYFWSFNGTPIQDNGHYNNSATANLMVANFGPGDAGVYQVVVSNEVGLAVSETQLVVHVVNAAGVNPVAPYATWATAATTIQDAINAATNGDFILVTNGIYQTGGLVMVGTLTNRAALNKPVTVQSLNGPWVTTILGAGATNGPNAVRCAWLTNNAALKGFTLKAGATGTSGDIYGGGVWCASSNALVANCVIVSNTAYSYGGGAWQGALENCLLSGNTTVLSGQGGGAANAVMTSCTVFSNANYGVYGGIYTNCIVYSNAPADHVSSSIFAWCCTTMQSAGPGIINTAPQLLADGVHLQNGSPCIGAGTNVARGTDIFGNAWANPPSMGCAEWTAAPAVSQPQIQLAGNPAGFMVGNAGVAGTPPFYYSWLQNGVPLQDDGHFAGTQTANLTIAGALLSDAAGFQLVVSNAFGVTTSAVVSLVIHCVAAGSVNPVAPYTNWATAATNIQSAITSAAAGDVVLVTNGVYATGGISMDGVITNCVSVNKAILVQSVNGPVSTIIQGAMDPTATNGPGAVRCVWMGTNAVLGGFTLQGGATRSGSGGTFTAGGGLYCASTNVLVYNCVIATNYASYEGGGVFANTVLTKPNNTTLINCTLTGNQVGSATTGIAGSGGGAAGCFLRNCVITANFAQGGGGTFNCDATNCAYVLNATVLFGSSSYNGGAASGGILVNCTVSKNTAAYYDDNIGAAVYGATLVNCLVYSNSSPTSASPNYSSCTMTYGDADPLSAGAGNIDVNPQLLADGIHLAATSPCLGAGTESVVSGTDIDGQAWNNPPAIGCDEWQPTPLIVVQPQVQINTPAFGLTVSTAVAGQSPSYFWSLNGASIQNDGRHSNSGTPNLTVNNFGPGDAGIYQVVVSNAFGMVTSQVAQVVMHVVNAAGADPVAPYSTWATAATNIQDAINAAAAGDIVLVTNGVYAYGGWVVAGNLTNRVALNKPVTVTSANGYAVTAIQGALDPVSTTTGPGAVRCAYVGDGAVLYGFTLQNGATRATGDGSAGGPLESGGGIYCNSANGLVFNCVLSNNYAIYGGGIINGILNNSLVTLNQASFYGGGTYYANLNNCTVLNNSSGHNLGAGTYYGTAQNSIVLDNYNFALPPGSDENYSGAVDTFNYCCSSPIPGGTGNIDVSPQFVDGYHLAVASGCRGAGSAAYASGTDLDGQPWDSPPSMGCSEVVLTNLVGPLSASISSYQTNVLINHLGIFQGGFGGHASADGFSFGDGGVVTNSGLNVSHAWNQPGNYTVTFTVYNDDHPAGVSASAAIQVLPILAPQLQYTGLATNGFEFQFAGQTNAMYTIEYTTNLVPPITWNTLQYIFDGSSGWNQVFDSTVPTGTRFYRVEAQ